MLTLTTELIRLYLPLGTDPSAIAAQLPGRTMSLVGSDGMARAMYIPFRKHPKGEEGAHWSLLCAVANGVQADLGFPPPAVSISGDDGYGLWLSLDTPVPAALAQEFLGLLHLSYFPEAVLAPDAAWAAVDLPPCMHLRTGKWSAFINPGLGASFADEAGLEMAPPAAGQVALLEGLHSIGADEFMQAMASLQPAPAAASPSRPVASTQTAGPAGLLLKDATLEDIVRHLHALHIEPTFRHLLRD